MSNSKHDPKNKECAIYGEEHEKEIECEHPCTCCPEQKEECPACKGDIHAKFTVITDFPLLCEKHKTQIDGHLIEVLNTHEQKEEWEEEFDIKWGKCGAGLFEPNYPKDIASKSRIKDFLRSQISLAEERGREEAITYIAHNEGWEEGEYIYRKHFGLPTKYTYGVKEHNMTLREMWVDYARKNYLSSVEEVIAYDWFLSQFDAMLAEDIDKLSKLFESSNTQTTVDGRIGFREGVVQANSILEARRLFIKK